MACNVEIRDNIVELILSYLWVPGLKLRSSALVTDILAHSVILLALKECFQSLIFNTLRLSVSHVTTAAEARILLLHKRGAGQKPVLSLYQAFCIRNGGGSWYSSLLRASQRKVRVK